MKPIQFICIETLPLAAQRIAEQILDLEHWPEFAGYGPLPGIKQAIFEVRTPGVVGSCIRVTNTDGSAHVEEIVAWEPERRVVLEMKEFSPPLSRLATKFDETWTFQAVEQGTRVTRSFSLYAKSRIARAVLWAISLLLRRAIARHMRQMKRQT